MTHYLPSFNDTTINFKENGDLTEIFGTPMVSFSQKKAPKGISGAFFESTFKKGSNYFFLATFLGATFLEATFFLTTF
ncbi:MAG: hypothetical protein JKY67_13065, partial [Pseudomonadales bacterium]|nr:hypothetical protein [Pseudomonadales bacterium]